MPSFSSYNALGTQIEANELASASVTFAKMGSDVGTWEHLETLSYSAETTKTSSTLTAHDEYMIVVNLFGSHATDQTTSFQINGDTGNNYDNLVHSTGGFSVGSNQANALLCHSTSAYPNYGVVLISGVGDSDGDVGYTMNVTGKISDTIGMKGVWDSSTSSVQVSTLTVLSTQNVTGTVAIYGRSRP